MIEVRTSVPRTATLTLLAVGSLPVAYYAAWTARGITEAAGWVALGLLPFAIYFGCRQLFTVEPIISIDETGVLDRRMGFGRIAWSDIASASRMSLRGHPIIALQIRNEELYLHKVSKFRASLYRLLHMLGLPSYSISFGGLEPSADEVYAALVEGIKRHSGD